MYRAVVLKGGLPAWVAAGGEVTEELVDDAAVTVASDAAAAAVAASYPAQLNQGLVKSMAEVTEALNGDVQLVDARSSGRFKGTAPEPRPEIPSGGMPGVLQPKPLLSVADARESHWQQVAAILSVVVLPCLSVLGVLMKGCGALCRGVQCTIHRALDGRRGERGVPEC